MADAARAEVMPYEELLVWRAKARNVVALVPTDPFKDDILLQDVIAHCLKMAVEIERAACATLVDERCAKEKAYQAGHAARSHEVLYDAALAIRARSA